MDARVKPAHDGARAVSAEHKPYRQNVGIALFNAALVIRYQ